MKSLILILALLLLTGLIFAGPSFMYGEWRDKWDVTDNTSQSKDRQYTGTGVVFPVMLGGESLITEKIGISLEVIVIAQAILLETFSKDNLDATDNTANIITFPIGSGFMGKSISPAVFKTQLSVIYHIMYKILKLQQLSYN